MDELLLMILSTDATSRSVGTDLSRLNDMHWLRLEDVRLRHRFVRRERVRKER